jgi:hypothetical protein
MAGRASNPCAHVGVVEAALDSLADRGRLSDAAAAIAKIRAWCDFVEVSVMRGLTSVVAEPEVVLAASMRTSLRSADRVGHRASVMASLPEMEAALAAGEVHGAHVDEVLRVARSLEPVDRPRLLDRVDQLVEVAAEATPFQWRRRLALEAQRIRSTNGEGLLARQRAACRAHTWVDDVTGMWHLRAAFDPVTGLTLSHRLEAATDALLHGPPVEGAPSDRAERAAFLRSHALRRLLEDEGDGTPSARPEIVIVVDTTPEPGTLSVADAGVVDGTAGLVARSSPIGIDWGVPVQVPPKVLADLSGDARVDVVVLRGGVILHAPGVLDLGRTTRLANRAQRRALRARYRGCAIPGCDEAFDRCTIHHLRWWRHGGRTDLANLVPVCPHHHTCVHERGWVLNRSTDGSIDVALPDGSIHPPRPVMRR